jgi:hypothetical protein
MALGAVRYISLGVPVTVSQICLPGATIEAEILGHSRRDDPGRDLAECTSEAEPMPLAVPNRPTATKDEAVADA